MSPSTDPRSSNWSHSQSFNVSLFVEVVPVAEDSRGIGNLPLPGNTGGIFSGDLTYYDPGLGSCGITSSSTDMICAISWQLYGTHSLSLCPFLSHMHCRQCLCWGKR